MALACVLPLLFLFVVVLLLLGKSNWQMPFPKKKERGIVGYKCNQKTLSLLTIEENVHKERESEKL